MRRISLECREKIKNLALAEFSCREIADQLEIGHMTVSNYMALYGIKSSKIGSGRPSKVSDRLKRLLIRKVEAGKFENAEATARSIKSAHNIDLTGQTVRNILRRAGLKNYAKPKKPRLNATQIKKRLIFARVHKEHAFDYYVMFTDESKFNHLSDMAIKGCGDARVPNFKITISDR